MDPSGMGYRLATSQRQEQLLLPQMLVAIEMLEMPVQDLDRWLVRAAEENEALSVESPGPGERDGAAQDAAGSREGAATDGAGRAAERFGDDFGSATQRRSGAAAAEASDRHRQMLENQPDREPSLSELVELELSFVDDAPELVAWVRFLAASLDERGFLSLGDEMLLELGRESGLSCDRGLLGAAIARLQSFEPRGLGARNAIEALILQLDPGDPDYALLCRLLEEFLDDVAKNRLPAVARAMELELGDLEELLERLRGLDPCPAAGLVQSTAPVIIPDITCLRDGDGFEIEVTHSALPSCRLDPQVSELARDRALEKSVRTYLKDKLARARWIVRGLEQRHTTLGRVAQVVFEHQRGFLEQGPGHLVPLSMVAAAEQLELATSTVSRSVAGKFVQTPWGIFPLRHFFQAKGGSSDSVAPDELGEAVRALFDSEDPAAPWSDDDAARELERRGFKIARRTLAKYRKELGIPSSYRRRRFS